MVRKVNITDCAVSVTTKGKVAFEVLRIENFMIQPGIRNADYLALVS